MFNVSTCLQHERIILTVMIHWRTRMTSPQIGAAHAVAVRLAVRHDVLAVWGTQTFLALQWNTSLTSVDYWNTWALAQFGPDVGPQSAGIFSAVESFNLPRPVNWASGPGTMAASAGMCNWATVYTFVDELAALRSPLLASIAASRADLAALERFDYWLGQFTYMRSIGACVVGLFWCRLHDPSPVPSSSHGMRLGCL